MTVPKTLFLARAAVSKSLNFEHRTSNLMFEVFLGNLVNFLLQFPNYLPPGVSNEPKAVYIKELLHVPVGGSSK